MGKILLQVLVVSHSEKSNYSWVNDFLCTQIVLKITITWFNSTFWMTFFGPAIRTKIWKKFFVQSVLEALRKEQRSRDTFLLSHWIDFLPGFGPTRNMNKVFQLKRFVNMAFRHYPLVLRLTKYTPSVNILSNSKHWIYEHTIGAAAWRVFECGHKQFKQSFELEISM